MSTTFDSLRIPPSVTQSLTTQGFNTMPTATAFSSPTLAGFNTNPTTAFPVPTQQAFPGVAATMTSTAGTTTPTRVFSNPEAVFGASQSELNNNVRTMYSAPPTSQGFTTSSPTLFAGAPAIASPGISPNGLTTLTASDVPYTPLPTGTTVGQFSQSSQVLDGVSSMSGTTSPRSLTFAEWKQQNSLASLGSPSSYENTSLSPRSRTSPTNLTSPTVSLSGMPVQTMMADRDSTMTRSLHVSRVLDALDQLDDQTMSVLSQTESGQALVSAERTRRSTSPIMGTVHESETVCSSGECHTETTDGVVTPEGVTPTRTSYTTSPTLRTTSMPGRTASTMTNQNMSHSRQMPTMTSEYPTETLKSYRLLQPMTFTVAGPDGRPTSVTIPAGTVAESALPVSTLVSPSRVAPMSTRTVSTSTGAPTFAPAPSFSDATVRPPNSPFKIFDSVPGEYLV